MDSNPIEREEYCCVCGQCSLLVDMPLKKFARDYYCNLCYPDEDKIVDFHYKNHNIDPEAENLAFIIVSGIIDLLNDCDCFVSSSIRRKKTLKLHELKMHIISDEKSSGDLHYLEYCKECKTTLKEIIEDFKKILDIYFSVEDEDDKGRQEDKEWFDNIMYIINTDRL